MRVIRIVRTPAIESALVRFDGWWGQRSHRERVMLGGLAIFLGLIVLIFGVIQPLQNARAKAFADIRTYETLNARLRAAGPLTQRASPPRTGPAEQVVSQSGAAFGLSPRVEPAAGGVSATLVDAPYDSVMSWLADLGATSRLRIRKVSLQRGSAAGRVNAVVAFGT